MKKRVDLVSVILFAVAVAAFVAKAKWGGLYGFSSGA
jgi:hypothetical protein